MKKLSYIILAGLILIGAGCGQSKKDGLRYTYYENGSIKEEYTYKKGVKDGKFRTYSEENWLLSEGIIQNGQVSEARYEYYVDGKMKSKINLFLQPLL